MRVLEAPLEPSCLPVPPKSQKWGGSLSRRLLVPSHLATQLRDDLSAPGRRCWALIPWSCGAARRRPPAAAALTVQGPDSALRTRAHHPHCSRLALSHIQGAFQPEQIFQSIKQDYSHYQKWSHTEVVPKACVLGSHLPPWHAQHLGSPGSSWMNTNQSSSIIQQVEIMCKHLLQD